MKKRIQTYTQKLKMPHLFREDLENIEEIIKKELNPSEYKLDLGSLEYQEIKEIPEDTNLTNEFYINTSSPYIRIDFNKYSARVFSGDDDVKTVGAVKKITDVILKNERRFLWYFSQLSQWLAPIILYIFSALFYIPFDREAKLSKTWLITEIFIILFLVIWWIAGYKNNLKKFSVIEFAYRKNKSNFFIRNKDQIIVGIIVAIVTVLLTLFFQSVFK